ncbi:MAG: hypothetical protein F6K58_26175 [Symploca sp. SIO2E9]|nr:hypothetical protein [Symploca sp. SIO2E9]
MVHTSLTSSHRVQARVFVALLRESPAAKTDEAQAMNDELYQFQINLSP